MHQRCRGREREKSCSLLTVVFSLILGGLHLAGSQFKICSMTPDVQELSWFEYILNRLARFQAAGVARPTELIELIELVVS